MHTREPGGTDVGVEIREIVLHRRGDIAPRAEALLYAADRAHHIATVVRPALERGDIVIQDRYLDSSVAYQGAGRVLDPAEVRDLSLWATEGLLPDLTVLLDLDATAGRGRLDEARTRYDRLEAEAGRLPRPRARRLPRARRRRARAIPGARRDARRSTSSRRTSARASPPCSECADRRAGAGFTVACRQWKVACSRERMDELTGQAAAIAVFRAAAEAAGAARGGSSDSQR